MVAIAAANACVSPPCVVDRRKTRGRSVCSRSPSLMYSRLPPHVGIYAFSAAFLQRFASLPPGRLEAEESLEQLRALEHGHRIRVADTAYRGFGIDTPEDLERARVILAAGA